MILPLFDDEDGYNLFLTILTRFWLFLSARLSFRSTPARSLLYEILMCYLVFVILLIRAKILNRLKIITCNLYLNCKFLVCKFRDNSANELDYLLWGL